VVETEVDPEADPGTEIPFNARVSTLHTTVLVVEDKPDVLKIVTGILSDLGCTIIEAKDGKSALSLLAERPDIDLLFTDVVLPDGISGTDIAMEARRILPGLKIVLTSGYPHEELDDLVSGGEFPWFIRKPYRQSEIAQLLDTVLKSDSD
jgi:CheY-like chemotaxis protein